MRTLQFIFSVGVSIALFSLIGCAPMTNTASDQSIATEASSQPTTATTTSQVAITKEMQLPVRYQKPSYTVTSSNNTKGSIGQEKIIIPVGADISSTNGPVPLRDILKKLAGLKNMNISWASDVDPAVPVDVDIRAEDDFFNAIDNLLRQKDYFQEVQGNTIVIKYKETRRFHIAMPNITSTYTTSVGGDVLGGTGTDSNVTGNIQIQSTGNDFNIWNSITENIEKVLNIWQPPVTAAPATTNATTTQPTAAAPTASATTQANPTAGQGHYSFDKQIGLITVTAPRPLLEKIAEYLDNLKKELYQQVSIEAKILEVTLDDTSTKGIDWSGMLSGKSLDLQLFGPNGVIYSTDPSEEGHQAFSKVTLPGPFSLALDFLDTQGDTKVLANPKITVMNGQPAMISVGDNVKYIDSVTTTVSDSGVPSTTVTTGSVMSGLGLAVVATIMDNDEVILSLTPVTSKLQEPIEYRSFGAGNTVGLPKVRLREMKTTVRIKNGQILVIGGLIDSLDDNRGNKVPFLGNLPGVSGLFSHKTKTNQRTELVILLQPKLL